MKLTVSILLGLEAQDKIVTMTQAAYGRPAEERTLYVECMDTTKQTVHAISGSGNRYVIPMGDVLDVEKCLNPITYVVPEAIWSVHHCDPAYLGKPVRAVQAMLSQTGKFTGLQIPKWPGSRSNFVLSLEVTAHQIGKSEMEILRGLPTTQAVRFHDSSRDRNQVARIAQTRISNFIAGVAQAKPQNLPPIDPSLKLARGILTPNPGPASRH